jgi:hypothetical protein
MTGNIETSAAILARLFWGPHASLGTDWVDSVQVGMPETYLHRVVVSQGTPTGTLLEGGSSPYHVKGRVDIE